MAGYDCSAFQQSPIKYYENYNECISVAIEKEKQLTTAYLEHGYFVLDSKSTCENVPAS